jgi:5'-deoxynucleotidase YfbR-like HD superfamily hydrolase
MSSLDSLLTLLRFTHVFRDVERNTMIGALRENDAEHSFQLALTVWYVAATNGMNIDLEKALKYALAHDLVEAYAGDLSAHERSAATIRAQKEREELALGRIETEFAEFPDLAATIRAYEQRQDVESKLVYALDKLLPAANIYLNSGSTWKATDVSLQRLREMKDDSIGVSDVANRYWEQLRAILEENEAQLFNPRPKD